MCCRLLPTVPLQGFAFVELRSVRDAEYACRVLGMVKLFGRPIRVDRSASSKQDAAVGAKLYVSGLSAEVDDKVLHDTFSAFGRLVGSAHVQLDAETGANKGFGFVEFDSFEAADAAMESLNGQYLCGRPLSVQYAYKRDTPNVRHGTGAERLMAAARKAAGTGAASFTAHTRFAAAGPSAAGMAGAALPGVSGSSSAAAAAAGVSGLAAPFPGPGALPQRMPMMPMMGHGAGPYGPPGGMHPGYGYAAAMPPGMMRPGPPPLPGGRVPRGFPVPHWAASRSMPPLPAVGGPPPPMHQRPPPLPAAPMMHQRPPPLPAAHHATG